MLDAVRRAGTSYPLSMAEAKDPKAFERFESLTKRLVQVPKKEIDKKAEEFDRQQKKRGRRKKS